MESRCFATQIFELFQIKSSGKDTIAFFFFTSAQIIGQEFPQAGWLIDSTRCKLNHKYKTTTTRTTTASHARRHADNSGPHKGTTVTGRRATISRGPPTGGF